MCEHYCIKINVYCLFWHLSDAPITNVNNTRVLLTSRIDICAHNFRFLFLENCETNCVWAVSVLKYNLSVCNRHSAPSSQQTVACVLVQWAEGDAETSSSVWWTSLAGQALCQRKSLWRLQSRRHFIATVCSWTSESGLWWHTTSNVP